MMAPLWSRGHNQPICSHLLVGLNNGRRGGEWCRFLKRGPSCGISLFVIFLQENGGIFFNAGLFQPELAESVWLVIL